MLGVNKYGTLKFDYDDDCSLITLGYFNWKWNYARKNYSTYEQEILSGILTLASQRRILSHLPIVWLCDQKAAMYFATADPPEMPRLRRWWTYISQFRPKTFHLPGIKNELCDLMSRRAFNWRFQVNIEEVSQATF